MGAAVLIGLVVFFGVHSCQGKVIEVGDIKVLVAAHQNSGSDVRGGGTLEVVGGCLGADGGVYVFPHGTKVVDEDPLTIDIPDFGEVSLGEEFEVGGGWELEHSSDQVEPGPYDVGGVTVPADCAKHDIFLAW